MWAGRTSVLGSFPPLAILEDHHPPVVRHHHRPLLAVEEAVGGLRDLLVGAPDAVAPHEGTALELELGDEGVGRGDPPFQDAGARPPPAPSSACRRRGRRGRGRSSGCPSPRGGRGRRSFRDARRSGRRWERRAAWARAAPGSQSRAGGGSCGVASGRVRGVVDLGIHLDEAPARSRPQVVRDLPKAWLCRRWKPTWTIRPPAGPPRPSPAPRGCRRPSASRSTRPGSAPARR